MDFIARSQFAAVGSSERRSGLVKCLVAGLSALSAPVLAHEGHGNTPWHALMHMLEGGGGVILLALVMLFGMLVVRARRQRNASRLFASPKSRHGQSAVPGDTDDSR